MQTKYVMSQIDRKSLAAFAILIIFSFGMAWVVLSKVDDAIEEFDRMNNSRDQALKNSWEKAKSPPIESEN